MANQPIQCPCAWQYSLQLFCSICFIANCSQNLAIKILETYLRMYVRTYATSLYVCPKPNVVRCLANPMHQMCNIFISQLVKKKKNTACLNAQMKRSSLQCAMCVDTMTGPSQMENIFWHTIILNSNHHILNNM